MALVQRENPVVCTTREQLVNWAARIARLSWSTEDDVSHASANAVALEILALADGVG